MYTFSLKKIFKRLIICSVVIVLGFMIATQHLYFSLSTEENKKFKINQHLIRNIYWDDEVEKRIPKGLSGDVADQWILAIRSGQIKAKYVDAEGYQRHGSSNCATGKALLTDGSKTCIRSRGNCRNGPLCLVAESISYWLARFLSLDNLPPVTLTYSNHTMWEEVKDGMRPLLYQNNLSMLGLTLWVDRMAEDVVLHKLIQNAFRSGVPLTKHTFKNVVLGDLATPFTEGYRESNRYPNSTLTIQPTSVITQEDVVLMTQFTTIIVFDYITDDDDRLYRHIIHPEICPVIPNVGVIKASTKLWIIDNEDAFQFDGKTTRDFNAKMIKTCCVFQRKVVEQLVSLSTEPSPWETFMHYVFQREPLLHTLNKDTWKLLISKEVFERRVREVVQWFEQCGKDHYMI